MAYDATCHRPQRRHHHDHAATSLGGIISEIDGNGGTTTITRTRTTGRPSSPTRWAATTTYTYDSSGDITPITQPDGVSENLTYTDSLGVPTAITDFNGNTTTFVLDSHGNVTEESSPAASTRSGPTTRPASP